MSGWWGFDCDATIAFYETWGDGSIGKPIEPMIRRIKHYLKRGRIVKIVTARVHPSHGLEAVTERQKVETFCLEHFRQILPVVCEKDMHMVTLFDDRATQVIPNKGITVQEELRRAVTALQRIVANVQYEPYSRLMAQDALSSLDHWSINLVKPTD